MNWWIFEDAMRDRKGHWLEYLRTFRNGLEAAGDEVRIFASQECETDVALALGAEPNLPRSIWARVSDGGPKLKKLWRIISHGIATWYSVSRLLRKTGNTPDIIFVPTVLVHHLLGWWLLLQCSLHKTNSKVLLFFPNTPAYLDEYGIPHWNPEPSAKLFAFLIRRCAKWVGQGRIILGAETEPMVSAMTQLTGVPFQYLPHPVEPLGLNANAKENPATIIRFGAYGSARYEKGSELIQEAIRQYLADQPDPRVTFALQWISDCTLPDGTSATLNPVLVDHPQCEIIHEFFPEGGYEAQIAKTAVMILPYRDAYRLRVSRVVIEAMQAGMPTIVAKGTTLHQQANDHGTLIECEQNSPQSILDAIRFTIRNINKLRADALRTAASSQEHFSVKTFRQLISQGLHG
jgi:glycosyltransferase involved in cell wall biosynthesis